MTAPGFIAPRKSLEPFISDDLEYRWWQIDGVRTLCQMNSFLLADEMGLGKSLQALTTFAVDLKLGIAKPGKMLVVCPVTLKGNWADEIAEHTRLPTVVLGEDPDKRNSKGKLKVLTKAERNEQIKDFRDNYACGVLIINYEQAVAHLAELNSVGFWVRCFDEAHYLKNYKAVRTKACMAIRARRTFILTGTPILNQVNELWTLLHMIEPETFPKYWRFVNRYCAFGGYQNKEIVGIKNKPELTNHLARVQVRRYQKDVFTIGEPLVNVIRVDLTPEQRDIYDRLADEDLLDIPDDPTPQQVESALVKFLRLKGICSTTATIPGNPDHSAKLDMAIEKVRELTDNGEKVIVFTQFRPALAAFAERMSQDKQLAPIPLETIHGDVPRQERVPRLRALGAQDGPVVAALMLQVGREGLNLQWSSNIIFIDKLFVPKLNDQAIGRANRIGQTRPVQVHEIIARNTIESRIEAILRSKRKIFGETVDQAQVHRALVQAMMGRAVD